MEGAKDPHVIIPPFSSLFLFIPMISAPSNHSNISDWSPSLIWLLLTHPSQHLSSIPDPSPNLLPIPLSPFLFPMTCVSYYGLFPVMPTCILCLCMFVSSLHATGLIPMVWTHLHPAHSTISSSPPLPFHCIHIASTSLPVYNFHFHFHFHTTPASASLHLHYAMSPTLLPSTPPPPAVW